MMGFAGVFLKEYVSGGSWVAVGAIVLSYLQHKLDHFSGNEEFLEDGRLLAVLGENEELSEKLESLEVL